MHVDKTPCLTLGVTLLVGPVDDYAVGPRVARDEAGLDLVLTEAEGRRAEAAAKDAEAAGRAAEAAGRAAEAAARERAEARVAELEKELATRGPATTT